MVARERRVGAVRPALLFAQRLEQPAVRASTEYSVAHGEGVDTRVGRSVREIADDDVALHRARAMHEQDLRLRAGRGLRALRDCGRGAAPIAEILLRERARANEADVSRHHEQRAVGYEARSLKGLEIVGRQRANRRRRGPLAVWMRPGELCGEVARGERRWLRLFELERRQRLRARQLDFFRSERGASDRIGDELEGL